MFVSVCVCLIQLHKKNSVTWSDKELINLKYFSVFN